MKRSHLAAVAISAVFVVAAGKKYWDMTNAKDEAIELIGLSLAASDVPKEKIDCVKKVLGTKSAHNFLKDDAAVDKALDESAQICNLHRVPN